MKRNLVLVGLLLVFGIAFPAVPAMATANGVTITASPGTYQVRGEGLAEPVGNITMAVAGNGGLTGYIEPGSSITISYAAAITNLADGALTIGTATSPVQCSIASVSTVAAPSPPSCGVNITATKAGNKITISFITAETAFAATGDSILILGVRVNASALGAGVTSVMASLSETSSAPSTNPISFFGGLSSFSVATVITPSLKTVYPSTPPTITTCAFNTGFYTASSPAVFNIKITEQFAAALTTLKQEQAATSDVDLAIVTSGVQVAYILSSVPKNMSVEVGPSNCVPPVPGNFCTTTPTGTLVLSLTSASPQKSTGADITFLFSVTASNTAVSETDDVTFGAYQASSSDLIALTAATVTGDVQLYPTGSILSTGLASPIVSFAANNQGSGTVAIVATCVTDLLYPWVVFIPGIGFDTGIAIANTTLDPSNSTATLYPTLPNWTAAAIATGPQNGSCTLFGYPTPSPNVVAPTGTVAAAAAPLAYTTPTIDAGATWAEALSNVAPFNAANFEGYIIAICQFQFAHSFVFISQNLGATNAVVQGYTALVVPNPVATPVGRLYGYGEGLGQ